MNSKPRKEKIFRPARFFFLCAVLLFFFASCEQPAGKIISAPELPRGIPAPSVIRGDGELSVSWAEEAGAAYELWYGTNVDSSGDSKWNGSVNRTTSTAGAVVSGLDNGTRYYFRVKKSGGESGPRVSFVPAAPPENIPGGFVHVPGGIIAGSGSYAMRVTIPNNDLYTDHGKTFTKTGVFTAGRIISLNSFFMAKDETTRELWYDVQIWAEGNDNYSFQNRMDGPPVEPEDKNKPVTGINWRDAVVWCNAYSEKSGMEPVYYYDGEPLKDSRDGNKAACDNAVMRNDKNGWRLPVEAEQEFAARGGDPGKPDWMFTYAGSNNAEDVAWHHGNSPFELHATREKKPNRLCIFDLSGNAQEWGWDWMNPFTPVAQDTPWDGSPYGGSFNQKPLFGGGIGSNITYSCVANHWGGPPGYNSSLSGDKPVGFRLVRKAE